MMLPPISSRGSSVVLFFLLYLFSPMFIFHCSSISTDGLTLLAFKSAISVDPSQSLASWVESDADPCSWTGIACDHHGRVAELSLPNRSLAGYLPSELGLLSSLVTLELPRNNLSGPLPAQLRSLASLTSLDLSHNFLSGPIPTDLASIQTLQHLDLSANQLNGSLPPSLATLPNLSGVLNLSFNALSGRIPAAYGDFPVSVSLDLRQNNLSGEIPQTGSLLNQGPTAFSGNPLLCGFPLKEVCAAPDGSAGNNPRVPQPNTKPDVGTDGEISFPSPRPAEPADLPPASKKKRAVAVPVLAGVLAMALVAVLLLQWQFRRRRSAAAEGKDGEKSPGRDDEERRGHQLGCSSGGGGEVFVAVDEGFGMELEELLRASAYVVGKSRTGIVYKVVVGRGGAAVAVRRLSEGDDGVAHSGPESGAWKRRRDFESEAMAIGRAKHPNVVSLRAYYYAPDEKLLVYDYIPNGSLLSALHGPRTNPSQTPLQWAARLKIIQGAARGLAYLHDCCPRKYIHGNIKASKILLDEDYHSYVSGFGLARLAGAQQPKSSSASSGSRKPSLSKLPSSSSSIASGYVAPESRVGPPTQKGDIYAFGVVLLEVLTGRMPGPVVSQELEGGGEAVELEWFVRRAFKEERPLSEIVDPALHHEVYAKKQVLAVFHVALGCTEPDPEMRPRMRAVSESLDRIGGPN